MLAHLSRPVIDSAGNRQTSVTVRVLQPGTNPTAGMLVAAPIYQDAQGATTLANPISVVNGLIDFFMDEPQFVLLGVMVGANPEEFYDWVVVNAPVEGYVNTPGVSSMLDGPILEVASDSGGQTKLALHSPSGQRYLLAIDDSGVISVTPS